MKKSIFLGKWFLCVLGAAVLAGAAGFTAGAAGMEGLETGWGEEQEIPPGTDQEEGSEGEPEIVSETGRKEQETIRETGREEDLEMNPEKMAEIRDQTEANMLGEFDFSEQIGRAHV